MRKIIALNLAIMLLLATLSVSPVAAAGTIAIGETITGNLAAMQELQFTAPVTGLYTFRLTPATTYFMRLKKTDGSWWDDAHGYNDGDFIVFGLLEGGEQYTLLIPQDAYQHTLSVAQPEAPQNVDVGGTINVDWRESGGPFSQYFSFVLSDPEWYTVTSPRKINAPASAESLILYDDSLVEIANDRKTGYYDTLDIKRYFQAGTYYGFVDTLTTVSLSVSPVLSGSVAIDGKAEFGQTLTADVAGLATVPTVDHKGDLTYVWKSGGTEVGTNSASYMLTQDDIGKTVTVTVTAEYCSGEVTSPPTVAVAKAAQSVPALVYTVAEQPPSSYVYTIEPVAGAEYKFDDASYSGDNVYTTGPAATLGIRMEETATHSASGDASVVVDATKESHAMPAAFILLAEDIDGISYTVTIPEAEGAEYSFDGMTYSGDNTKEGCLPGETVTGYMRMKADATHNAGSVVKDSVTLPLFQVKTPTATPAGGTFTGSQSVSLATSTPGAEIHYTTDGSTPTAASTNYAGAFTLTATTAVKAIAVKAGMRDSDIMSAVFTKESGYSGGGGGSVGTTPAQTPEESTASESAETAAPSTPSGAISASQFADAQGHWAYSAISFVVSNGLFNGVSDTGFAPDAAMTRAMFATVLARYAGGTASGSARFSDVPAGQWYTDGVLWATENKIVSGVGNGLFDPDRNITREQLAVMLYNYAKNIGLDVSELGDLAGFGDAGTVSDWAEEALRWAVAAGLINGKPGELLDPKGTATRAEVATILQRFIEKTQ
jgi:hypothetical protein